MTLEIVFTARTKKAEEVFFKYMNNKNKHIKKIYIIKKKPVIIGVVPKLNLLMRQAVKKMAARPELWDPLLFEMKTKYRRAMMAEGLGTRDYYIEVRV